MENNGTRLLVFVVISCWYAIDYHAPFVFGFSLFRNSQRTTRQTSRASAITQSFSSSHQKSVADGLLEESLFQQQAILDETIRELRTQLPSLLSLPLSRVDRIFTNDTQLVVQDNFVLAHSRDEVAQLSNALLLFLKASKGPAQFLLGNLFNASSERIGPQLHLELVLHRRPDGSIPFLQVQWQADLLFPVTETLLPSNPQYLKGTSVLTLQQSQVKEHRLENLSWNEEPIDATLVAEFLSNIRSTVQSVSILPGALSKFLLLDATPSVLESLWDSSSVGNDDDRHSSTPVLADCFVCDLSLSNTTSIDNDPIPIDDYQPSTLSVFNGNDTNQTVSTMMIPVPGSEAWQRYATIHQAVSSFVKHTIPVLSGQTLGDFSQVFATNVTLETADGSELVGGNTAVSNFYKLLAGWFRLGFVDWKLQRVKVLGWDVDFDECTVDIELHYQATMDVPGGGPRAVSGIDLYTLQCPNPTAGGSWIQRIQQTEFSLGTSSSNKREGARFMRSIVAAMESGRNLNEPLFLVDVLLRATLAPGEKLSTLPTTAVTRSDSSALAVYRIMEELLQHDFAKTTKPPLGSRLDATVTLVGYLGEPLVRGQENYLRTIQLVLAGLPIREQPTPSVRVELTGSGAIRCAWTLWLDTKLPKIAVVVPESLKVSLVSEYTVVDTTIVRHQLLETTVNDQLTPGDVVSRWVQSLSSTRSPS